MACPLHSSLLWLLCIALPAVSQAVSQDVYQDMLAANVVLHMVHGVDAMA
jgi:hypothetical protein